MKFLDKIPGTSWLAASNADQPEDKLKVGGQAVIEGVMMRSPSWFAVSVRLADGSIETTLEKYESLTKKFKLFSKPFFRGMVVFGEMLVLGIKSLSWSAERAAAADVQDKDKADREKEQKHDKAMSVAIGASLVTAFIMGLGLFLVLPYFLTGLTGLAEAERPLLFNIVDGFMRMVIFLGYVWIISRWSEIHRVFEYHGAEHMSIFAWEADTSLDVNGARNFGTRHPSCGTSFIFIVLIIGILCFSLLPLAAKNIVPAFITWNRWLQKLALIPVRILFLPVIGGISYELLKFSSNRRDNPIVGLFTAPGLWLQKITTQPPDDSQLEVALASLKAVLKAEGAIKEK